MAQTFTPPALDRAAIENLSTGHKEPTWLLENRLSAFDRFAALPEPNERSEGWRRTDLRGISFDYEVPRATGPGFDLITKVRPDGIIVEHLRDAVQRHEEIVREAFSHKHTGLSIGKYSALAESAWENGAFVYVPDGVEASEYVHLLWDGGPYSRLLVVLGKNSRLSLLDWHRESGIPAPNVADLILAQGARLIYSHVQEADKDSVPLSHQRAQLGRDAKLVTLNFALGGRLSRADIEVELRGQGAESDMLGLIFGEGEQQFDFHTLQGHRAPDTRSDLLFKSALDDRSHSTYTGVISIGKDAPRSEAYQANRNLLLAEGARADTEPKLEILIDDVARCTHGATIGPVDDEQLFYLQSRGLSSDTAARIIVEGFFQEVLQKLGDKKVAAELGKLVEPHVSRLEAKA